MIPKLSWSLPSLASSQRQQVSNSASLRLLLQTSVCIVSVVLGLRTFQQASLVVLTLHLTEQPQEQARNSPQISRVQDTPGFADFAVIAGTTKKSTVNVQQLQLSAQLISQPVVYSWNYSGSNFSTRPRISRQKILVREWPHPNATEMMKGFDLIARVQLAHRLQRRQWKPVIVITPTHARMFQALHLTGLMHTLSLVQAPVIWIVVEAGGRSHVTAELLKQAQVHLLVHVGYPKSMPVGAEECWIMESHMRVEGLRFVREKKLEGVVMFADDSNVQALDFFNVIQQVEWVGVVPLGILGYAGFRDSTDEKVPNRRNKESFGFERNKRRVRPIKSQVVQVRTLTQHANGTTNGWHVPWPVPLDRNMWNESSHDEIMQWAGFAMNAQAVWETGGSVRPRWLRD